METNKNIGLSICLVNIFWREWNPANGDEEKLDDEKLLKKEEVQELIDILLDLIRKNKDNNSLLRVYELREVLLAWRNWSQNGPQEWIEKTLEDEQNIPLFLKSFINFQSCQGAGSSFYTSYAVINPKEINLYYDSVKLKGTCEKLLAEKANWLNSNDIKILDLFVTNFDNADNMFRFLGNGRG